MVCHKRHVTHHTSHVTWNLSGQFIQYIERAFHVGMRRECKSAHAGMEYRCRKRPAADVMHHDVQPGVEGLEVLVRAPHDLVVTAVGEGCGCSRLAHTHKA